MSDYSLPFLVFWAAYPRKVGKGAAWRAFQSAKATVAMVDVMLEALAWQTQQPGWREQGGRFIPHPKTWLNGRRWEDEQMRVTSVGPRHIIGLSGPVWECPHDTLCESWHYCRLKVAKSEAGL